MADPHSVNAVPDLDPVIHPAARLRIVTTLASQPAGEPMTFTALQHVLGMTVGNLSTHLAKLEGAGYAELNKTFHGKRPVTHVRLSQTGWTAFEHYLENLNQLLGSLT